MTGGPASTTDERVDSGTDSPRSGPVTAPSLLDSVVEEYYSPFRLEGVWLERPIYILTVDYPARKVRRPVKTSSGVGGDATQEDPPGHVLVYTGGEYRKYPTVRTVHVTSSR